VRARRAGQAIVDEAKRRGVQAVVLAAEEPSKIRGGALLGGRGGPLDDFVGESTKYVLSKAPCQVILTAPPASDAAPPADARLRADRAAARDGASPGDSATPSDDGVAR
jgi:basic amino acid/polyamine antiporter, APA family